ncbi:TPA: AbrB/MazE/SpoVT family DNA-binding domain-containing protein [Candidatus Woesearchaeota archaeon]|nr:AbrB/MazE/SpoVT family DNA-binding domain-containing protein [Candidatus Woesearchaeota archaeon]
MNLIEMRTATITEKGQISIPNELRKLVAFKTGSKIAILAFDDHVELRPMNQINKKLFGAIASEKSLAKTWNTKEEDKAWKNL